MSEHAPAYIEICEGVATVRIDDRAKPCPLAITLAECVWKIRDGRTLGAVELLVEAMSMVFEWTDKDSDETTEAALLSIEAEVEKFKSTIKEWRKDTLTKALESTHG